MVYRYLIETWVITGLALFCCWKFFNRYQKKPWVKPTVGRIYFK